MMEKKRRVKLRKPAALVMALCLLPAGIFSSFAVTGAEAVAATTPTLTINAPDQLPEVGKTFSATVDLSGNPGICAIQFTFAFDDAVLECTKASLGKLLNGTLSATNPKGEDGAIIAVASTSVISGDGTVASFDFKVLKQGNPAFALKELVLVDEAGEKPDANVASESALASAATGETEQAESGSGSDNTSPGSAGTSSVATPSAGMSGSAADTAKEETTENSGESSTALMQKTFSDVAESHWAYENIRKAAEKELVSGYEDGTFRAEQNVTRAEFVTMLWRMAGKPESASEAAFSDVSTGDWYVKQISWAAENGIVNGKTAAAFCPNEPVTRQEAMTILLRRNGGSSGAELLLTSIYDSQYADSSAIADWAKSGMYWAVYHGLITGVTANELAPAGNATRAQIAVILVRYAETQL